MSNNIGGQKKRKRGDKTSELQNDPNVERKLKLEKDIRELNDLISKMEHSLNLTTFKNIVSKEVDKKMDIKKSSVRLIDIQGLLRMEMYKYTGLYCSKFDSNCVFTLTSGQKCIKNNTYCVEVIKDEEVTKIGRWVMPMGMNAPEMAKKYPIKEPKFLKLFLKDCHRSITCYSHRESQFLETKEYLSNLINCILEANPSYTTITIQIFRLTKVETKESFNVRLYFHYDTFGIRPIRMNVESINYSNEVPADIMEYLYTAYKGNFETKNLKEAMDDFFKMFKNSTLLDWSKMAKEFENIQTQHEEEEDTNDESDSGLLDSILKGKKKSPRKGKSSRRKIVEEHDDEERSQENNDEDSELDEEEKKSKPNKRRKIDSEKLKARKSNKEKILPNDRKNVKSQKKSNQKKMVTFGNEIDKDTNIEASEVGKENLESEACNPGDYDSGKAVTNNLEKGKKKIPGGSGKNNIETKNKTRKQKNSSRNLNSNDGKKLQRTEAKGSRGSIKRTTPAAKLKESSDSNKIEENKKIEGNEHNLDRSLRKSLLIRKTTENAEEINWKDLTQNVSELTGNVKCSTPVAKSDIKNMNRMLREENFSII